jgi:hypothetical protein
MIPSKTFRDRSKTKSISKSFAVPYQSRSNKLMLILQRIAVEQTSSTKTSSTLVRIETKSYRISSEHLQN